VNRIIKILLQRFLLTQLIKI